MLNNSRGVIVDKQFDPTGPLPKEKELLDGQCMSIVTSGDLVLRKQMTNCPHIVVLESL